MRKTRLSEPETGVEKQKSKVNLADYDGLHDFSASFSLIRTMAPAARRHHHDLFSGYAAHSPVRERFSACS